MNYRNSACGFTLVTMGVALTACGGGGVNSTPTPTPPPTPTPAPPPSYNTVAQALAVPGDKSFSTAGIKYDSGASAQATYALGADFKFEYIASTDSYRITRNGEGAVSFALSSGIAFPASNVVQYTSGADSLFVLTPIVSGTELQYTRFVTYGRGDSAGNQGAWGIPTVASDVPKTGTATYAVSVAGLATNGGGIFFLGPNSGGNFTANFGAGTVSTTIVMRAPAAGQVIVQDLGILSGSGTISSSSPGFMGTLGPAGSGDPAGSGKFSGSFFGPQAQEFGYTWFFEGSQLNARGQVAGMKN